MTLLSLAFVLLACGSGQSPECAAYMSCMEAVDEQVGSNGAASVDSLYGKDGTCWSEPLTAASCDAGCIAGLEAARDSISPLPPACEE